MTGQEDNIYSAAPDEFAAFLDGTESTVSLKKLKGENNPFVKAGIYKLHKSEPRMSSIKRPIVTHDVKSGVSGAVCPCCGEISDVAPDLGMIFADYEADDDTAENFSIDEGIQYELDHPRLANFVANGIGCPPPRQFQKGWFLGKLRDYDVYFACDPTKGMYKALESTPKSVLIIGKNTPEQLPAPLATRVIYLSRLLYVCDGELHFAEEAIDEKIPSARPGGRKEAKKPAAGPKKKSRPGIEVYAPGYLEMIYMWLNRLHAKQETGTPKIRWVHKWMAKNFRIEGHDPVGEHQTRVHIKTLLKDDGSACRHRVKGQFLTFRLFWQGCESVDFVERFAGPNAENLTDMIAGALAVANKDPRFKVHGKERPMLNMDATDYADKVKND